jgi:hypothetical protein
VTEKLVPSLDSLAGSFFCTAFFHRDFLDGRCRERPAGPVCGTIFGVTNAGYTRMVVAEKHLGEIGERQDAATARRRLGNPFGQA